MNSIFSTLESVALIFKPLEWAVIACGLILLVITPFIKAKLERIMMAVCLVAGTYLIVWRAWPQADFVFIGSWAFAILAPITLFILFLSGILVVSSEEQINVNPRWVGIPMLAGVAIPFIVLLFKEDIFEAIKNTTSAYFLSQLVVVILFGVIIFFVFRFILTLKRKTEPESTQVNHKADQKKELSDQKADQ